MKPSLSILLPATTALLLATAIGGEAVAQQRDQGQRPQQARGQQQANPLSDSVRRIERRTGGQVLSAEQVQFDGRDVSRIKVMDDRGRVRVYMDDPAQRGQRRSGSRRDDD